MEILIHIGINTVELGGKGFRLHVSQGQKVRRGDCLVDVDLEEVRKSGKDLTTMVIFTTGESVDVKSGEAVTAGAGFEIRIGMRKQKSRHIRKQADAPRDTRLSPPCICLFLSNHKFC